MDTTQTPATEPRLTLAPFTRQDWQAFAGAETPACGAEPQIAQHTTATQDDADSNPVEVQVVAIADANGLTVDHYSHDGYTYGPTCSAFLPCTFALALRVASTLTVADAMDLDTLRALGFEVVQ
jgi:hypothetical protein